MQHEEGRDRGEYGFGRENQRRVGRGRMPLSPHQERIRERGCENRRDDYAELHLKCEADKERFPTRHIQYGHGDGRGYSRKNYLQAA